MNKFMRILVFFDLPVKTAGDRRSAAQFRNFLLKDGYHMIQYSVYTRICNGTDDVEKHETRLSLHLPRAGSVRSLVITENQYDSMKILLGSNTFCDGAEATELLNIF